MAKFKLKSKYQPTADQKKAIDTLVKGHENGVDRQVLLGVTGSGKTFTTANVIQRLQKPALIISHNKTLAAQLYQEMRDFFPDNAVSFFVSYYDYYQPEAYIASTDTYIEKDAGINDLIDKLRLATTANLMTRKDTIVISSVSCIYNIGSPNDYSKFVFVISKGSKMDRDKIVDKLIDLQYERGEFGFHRGTFRLRGDTLDIFPAYQDEGVRLELGTKMINDIQTIDPVSGEIGKKLPSFSLYPAKHFMADTKNQSDIFKTIENDLEIRVKQLKKEKKEIEAHRLSQRVTYDLEMIKEMGYVKGIENYSMYFDGRSPGDPPNTLLDFFSHPYKNNWLTFVDESHITFPQIRGMFGGDRARKKNLVDHGFRLPSSFDNRPLTFDEFVRKIPNFIATSATPSDWEINQALESSQINGKSKENKGVVEQLLRPTGIPDPMVEIRPIANQVADVIEEVKKRANPPNAKNKQRTLLTTLTKKTAEDLANYLNEKGLKVHYLHSDVKTLDRTDILDDLRRGEYDCLVGINLLREGLDLPEVSLVAILDADKEGFLRSDVTLIQTMGRAARHSEGKVILYADKITGSIKRALAEVGRRRKYQVMMNKKLGITPTSIQKPIRERVIDKEDEKHELSGFKESTFISLPHIDTDSLTPLDKEKLIRKLKREMTLAAHDLNFELAAEIRDKVKQINKNKA